MSESSIIRGCFDADMDLRLQEMDARLRKQNRVLVDLARRKSIHSGDLVLALREITEAAAATLEIDRVGVWFYTEDRTAIRCVDLYERSIDRHSEGLRVEADDFPAYFQALESERIISAPEAQ